MPSQPPVPGDAPEPATDAPTEPVPPVEAAPAEHPTVESTTELPGGVPAGPGVSRHEVWRWARWPVYGLAAVLALFLLGFAWLWVSTDLPANAALSESAVLVDRNGEELAVLAQDGLRFEIPLDEMGELAPDAVVAAEDRRFFDHDGVDPAGVVRAFWNNLRDDDTQGGSTLTQQLVKNVYLDSDRTITRKLREAVLAVKLERDASKEEILERYLNTVYFGRGSYGIEAAARTYFDTSAAELQLHQVALLVGILPSPEALDPGENPTGARDRRDAVLDAMVATGAVDQGAADAARSAPVEVAPLGSTTQLTAGVAPHFVEQVRQEVIERFGERALYDQGLVVHTTLDIADQRAAEAAVATHLDDPADPQAAVVGVDRSGAVRAWVGGRDYEALKVDLVSSDGGGGRQPGSTFKPLVLAANLEEGFGAGQMFRAPSEITLDVPPEPWEVSNAGGDGHGTISLAEATVKSVNTVYAQAVAQIGPEPVVDIAKRMGVERDLSPQLAIALGTEVVSPLELATVYSTFARSGQRIDPFRIAKIETRDGEVLFERSEPEPEEAVEARVADTVTSILSETPRRGTARRAALDRPMAAKTGTTQNNADAWLAGYTPEYTTIVWMGYPDGTQPMDSVDGVRVQGGSTPAMIWHDFMAVALEDVEPTDFPEPDRELLGRGDGDRDSDYVVDTTRPRREDQREDRSSTTTSTSSTSTTTTTEPEEGDEGNEGDDGNNGGGNDGEPTTTTTAPPATTTTAPPEEEEQTAPSTTAASGGA